MDTKRSPLSQKSDLFADLSVNGINLSEFSPEMLAEYGEAWDRYIARLSQEGEHDQEVGVLLSLAHLRRAFAALIQGEPDVTIAHASRVIDRQGREREVNTAHLLRAYACGATRDVQLYGQGILDWDYVFSLYECGRDQPSHETLCTFYLERAQLHAELSHYERAVADCNRAGQSGPLTAALLSVRGLARGYLGEERHALEDCSRSIEMEETPDGYYRRGHLFSHLGRFAEAYADFERAHALDPDAPDILEALYVAGLRGTWQWMENAMKAVRGGEVPYDGPE